VPASEHFDPQSTLQSNRQLVQYSGRPYHVQLKQKIHLYPSHSHPQLTTQPFPPHRRKAALSSLATTPLLQFHLIHISQARYQLISLSICLEQRQLRLAALCVLASNPPSHPLRPIPSPPTLLTVPNAIRDTATSQYPPKSHPHLNRSRPKK
jgi:hypothetical protein